MSNFYDYLAWRGDIPFDQIAPNEVDALILTWLIYADLKDVVPPNGRTISDASEVYFQSHEHLDASSFAKSINPMLTSTVLLERLPQYPRFANLLLTDMMDVIDYENPRQFAAVTVHLTDELLFVSFRGTDRTLVGWQEDFYISCMDEIPAQRDALNYLVQVAEKYPAKKMMVGGHSKGGNLAAYATIFAPEAMRERILICYNNDGPGFSQHVLSSDAYRVMRHRIKKFVPEASIVGMLFDYENDYQVIKSDQISILQHNGICWQVMGTHFVYADSLLKSNEVFDHTLQLWLSDLDNDARRTFIDTLFGLFEKSGIETIDDISFSKPKSILALIHAMTGIDANMRNMLGKTFFGIIKARLMLNASQKPPEEQH